MAESGDASLDNNQKESNDVVDSTQELLMNIHELMVKNQNEQKKFNEEMLEKIDKQSEDHQKMMNSIDEMQTKTDKFSERLQALEIPNSSDKLDDADKTPENEPKPIDNATSFYKFEPPVLILPTAGKSFVMKHEFKNVQKLKEGRLLFSGLHEYFGVSWKIGVGRVNLSSEDFLSFHLHCAKPNEKWLIDVSCKIHLLSINSKPNADSFHKVFGTDPTNWRLSNVIQWEKLEQEFVDDQKFAVEAHVEIYKMTGIYKNNLRKFDESMEMFSDVVLIVNRVKFYVSKLYLATHSPYFQSLFLGHFQESNKSEIKLSGIDPDDFQNYLEVLYGDKAIDETTVEGILLISDMYDTPSVIKKCEEFLIGKSGKNLKKKLELSSRYNLKQLEKKCLSEINTADDIRSVLSGVTYEMDQSIRATLLEKLLEFQQQ